jgi:hypothetical protein
MEFLSLAAAGRKLGYTPRQLTTAGYRGRLNLDEFRRVGTMRLVPVEALPRIQAAMESFLGKPEAVK